MFDQIIHLLNIGLEDLFMLAVWGSLAAVSFICATARKDWRMYLLTLACLPPALYFMWAYSELWHTHEVATAFNRSAQVTTVVILFLFVIAHRRDFVGRHARNG